MTDTQKPWLERNAHRVYGGMCGTSNILLAAGGAFAHQPLMMAGAGISLAAQIYNTRMGDAARPITTPILIASGGFFAAAGLHPQMDIAKIGFGVCKTLGITALFHGTQIGERLATMPGLRLLGRVLRAHGGLVAEALLITGSTMLAYKGAEKLVHGMLSHDWSIADEGACTVTGLLFFVGGNRVRSMFPQEPQGSLRDALALPGSTTSMSPVIARLD